MGDAGSFSCTGSIRDQTSAGLLKFYPEILQCEPTQWAFITDSWQEPPNKWITKVWAEIWIALPSVIIKSKFHRKLIVIMERHGANHSSHICTGHLFSCTSSVSECTDQPIWLACGQRDQDRKISPRICPQPPWQGAYHKKVKRYDSNNLC